MSKHTPGPWVVGNVDPLNFGVQRDWGIKPIGFVYGPSFPERSEVGQRALANARLIAVAPMMYEYIVSSASNGCAEAKKLIAKAEGKL